MTIEIKEDGEDYNENTIVTGVLKGIMTGFRELVGDYRSHSTEDNLTNTDNTDEENTTCFYVPGSHYKIYPLVIDETFDSGTETLDEEIWDIINVPDDGEDITAWIKEDTEEERLEMWVEHDSYYTDSSNNILHSENALWTSNGDSIKLINFSTVGQDSDQKERYNYIEVTDGENHVELWHKTPDEDEPLETYDYGEVEITYDSENDEMSIYLDGELDATKDVSDLSTLKLRLRQYIDTSYGYSATSWIRADAVIGGQYETNTNYTYQTSSVETTSENVIGGILLYDEDQAQIPSDTNLTAYVSSNGGSNWSEVKDNIFRIPKDQQGTDLRFKFDMSTTDANSTPKINKWKYLYLTNINP